MSNNDILDLICCPNCKSDLDKIDNQFLCDKCGSKYREKDGVIILISKKLEDELRS